MAALSGQSSGSDGASSGSEAAPSQAPSPQRRLALLAGALALAAFASGALVLALAVAPDARGESSAPASVRALLESPAFAEVVAANIVHAQGGGEHESTQAGVAEHVAELSRALLETEPSKHRQLGELQLSPAEREVALEALRALGDERALAVARSTEEALAEARSSGVHDRALLARRLVEKLRPHENNINLLREKMLPKAFQRASAPAPAAAPAAAANAQRLRRLGEDAEAAEAFSNARRLKSMNLADATRDHVAILLHLATGRFGVNLKLGSAKASASRRLQDAPGADGAYTLCSDCSDPRAIPAGVSTSRRLAGSCPADCTECCFQVSSFMECMDEGDMMDCCMQMAQGGYSSTFGAMFKMITDTFSNLMSP